MPFFASQAVIFGSLAVALIIIRYLQLPALGLVIGVVLMLGGLLYLSAHSLHGNAEPRDADITVGDDSGGGGDDGGGGGEL